MSRQSFQFGITLWTAAVCACWAGGCAGIPRIDPTGERIFIWPHRQVAPLTDPFVNVQAQPAFTDSVFPPQTPSSTDMPGLVAPAVPFEKLTLDPDRVLAPVGSEVVLRSGICTDENYLVTHRRVEWMISREGVGEFVSVGGRGFCRTPLLPWNKPKKIDNQLATGYTATVPLTITRGSADPRDHVQIEPGHAWASITSPVEGTTHVTTVAPDIFEWSQRRATAAIYWVDIRWTLPAASITASGSQVLTTVLRRQTDDTPLEGWVVRYEVAGGTGAFAGRESGSVLEVVTGADGTASANVTPVGSAGATTTVNVQVVRPARLAGSDMPRLIVANGATTINWASDTTPYLPPADDLGSALPTDPMPESRIDVLPPSAPITPTPPAATSSPELELEIFGDAERPVRSEIRFEVLIRNVGSAMATGLVLRDEFDAGLSHLRDPNRTLVVENPTVGNLAPGESKSVFLTFDILSAGNLCHEVTVRSSEGASASARKCVNATQSQAQPRAGLEVRKDGPRLREVGQTALFVMSVRNTGEVPLQNLEILDEYDNVLAAQPKGENYERIRQTDNKPRFLWRFPRLDVGQTINLEVETQCQAPKQRACSIVHVSADGGPGVGVLQNADEHCLEIETRRVPGEGPTDVVPSETEGGLRLSIVPHNRTPIAGSRTTYQLFLENSGSSPDEEVRLRVSFPPELVPDMASVRADVGARLVGNEIQFNPIAEIRPNERLPFLVIATVVRPGIVNISAEVTSRKVTQPVQRSVQIEIVSN